MAMTHRWVEQTGLPGCAGRQVPGMTLETKPSYLPERASVLATSSPVGQCLRTCTQHPAVCVEGLCSSSETYDQRKAAQSSPPAAQKDGERGHTTGIAGTEPGKWEKREDVTTVAPEELNNKNLDLL